MIKIGTLQLTNPMILAPLAGYTDLPFRLLCREFGASLCYSEMISCHGLVYHQKNTIDMIRSIPEERPVAMQLFGGEADVMGAAAAILSDYPIDIIDINMGCPVKKVVKKGGGAALMKNPQLAERIIRKVCANTNLPVTVKTRTGWTHQEINVTEFVQMAEQAGAAAVTVHGRTWSDGFGGSADQELITAAKRAVTIPIIGNGDILSYDDGIRMMGNTGCDAVMIGRGALGNPWVFDKQGRPTDLSDIASGLTRHLELIARYCDPEPMLARIKNHGGRYFKGLPGSSTIRQSIYAARSFQELQKISSSLTKR
ncbi:MAG: tRNA dihydrouridine synthase DusB [Proteobacteria bacterium]|nr:tRNA dihydrouridine synthase DusB [Pseudomonadota bacterium]MBU1688072.1 tRNA dihydrouridine synthase DusB [Pseudomonadota bacterium]